MVRRGESKGGYMEMQEMEIEMDTKSGKGLGKWKIFHSFTRNAFIQEILYFDEGQTCTL